MSALELANSIVGKAKMKIQFAGAGEDRDPNQPNSGPNTGLKVDEGRLKAVQFDHDKRYHASTTFRSLDSKTGAKPAFLSR